jgi:hypothetical protein
VADCLLAPIGVANGHDYYFRSIRCPGGYTEAEGYECLFTTLGGTMHGDYNAQLAEMLLIDACILVFGVEIVVNFRSAAGSLNMFARRSRCYFFYLAVSLVNFLPTEVGSAPRPRLAEGCFAFNQSSVDARHTRLYIRLWTKLKAMLTFAVSKIIFLLLSRFNVPANNNLYHRLQSQL